MLVFNTANAGTLGTRMVIDNTGNVGIGTTSPQRKLEVSGSIRMGALITGGGSAVAVYRDANGDLADSTSSRQYKTDISALEEMLPKIKSLNLVRFKWNEHTATAGLADAGMIAEEVNQILPDLVTYEADGTTPRGLKYEKMGLFALKGLQEQEIKLDELGNVIETVKEQQKKLDVSQVLAEVKDKTAANTDELSRMKPEMENIKTELAKMALEVQTMKLDELNVGLGETPEATISGNLLVAGKSTLAEVSVTGKISNGVLIVNGLNGEMHTLAGALTLQADGLNGIKLVASKIEIDTRGNLSIKEGVILGNSQMRDEAILAIDQTEVIISRTWEKAPVTISVTPSYETVVWVENVTKDGFTIKVGTTATKEEKVYWSALW
jgi:hypothetical protein